MEQSRQQWTKEEIKENITKDDKWMERGLVAIFNKQTADEQSSEATKHYNNIGFNKVDSKFMSSVAKFFIVNGYLSPKQKVVVRKKLLKYSSQLSRIANGEI